ncbi:DUF3221 domain-containing protein [Sporosarcina pasteurii]|uniref:Protein of uncharacterized function (DUF3221) n=1 Tax=Sporosarcina pasteurii TaxID=1474 RepID=A0A380C7P6_SPOPA|nr:DUF3221 domain-containing protein [Sporosarcina pasteurii]MDS9472994.1 DUF3221 domain-containing protein [Sporosarcina pasteurii]QBQ04507.1 DUF3221 domain-containing protein [Sporosarcina pasteurii]SUJ14449.1 Protein of uncharacterised function (DUF3221) [Sporosarcina pasteurii]
MRFLIAMSMVLFLMGCSSTNPVDELDVDSDDLTAYHEDKYFDAFVISKGINTFTIIDDLDNKSGEIIVSMEGKDKSSIRTLKKNDKVRIWHDVILESYPAKTRAYRIEVLEE